ncbi:MAG: LysR family transcriptional regulator [Gaiellaceae bacterium]
MLLTQVEGFIEVARSQKLGRAAGELFITQPALTARIQRLEQDLGVPLFVRTPTGMRLTDPGRTFLPWAVRALEALEEGRRHVEELARGSAGELSIGAAPAVSTYVLPALLKSFSDDVPNVSLVVRTGHSEEVLDMVLRGEVEVGLVRALLHPQIQSVPFYEETLALVADPSHPFAARASISIAEIGDAQLILFDRTSSYHGLTSSFFREAGVAPRGVMELDNIDAANKMVQQGLGLALLPQTAVAAELADGSLVAVRIADVKPVRRQIVAVRRKDDGAPTGLVAAFMEKLSGAEVVATRRRG